MQYLEYPGQRAHDKAISDTQRNVIEALAKLEEANAMLHAAAMPLIGTKSGWRYHALHEAIAGHVMVSQLHRAINAIMDDCVHRMITTNPTFTQPKG